MKKFSLILSVCILIPAVLLGFRLHPQKAGADPVPAGFRSAVISDIQALSEGSGIARTADAIYRTDNGGASWTELPVSLDSGETMSGVRFFDPASGWVVIGNAADPGLRILKTSDGGANWTPVPIEVRSDDLAEARLDDITLETDGITGRLKLRLPSSSNFVRTSVYTTRDGARSWQFVSSTSVKATDYASQHRETELQRLEDNLGLPESENIVGDSIEKGGSWILTQSGSCVGVKVGCTQTTKVYDVSAGLRDITPPQIRDADFLQKERARLESTNSVFAQAPIGPARISLNRGFDKCTAGTVAQMQIWWDTSWFYDANIYMSGRNRGCSQPQLTAAWVTQVSNMGWGLIPTIVGYQSPCSVSTNSVKHSSDPVVAESQGRGEADIAVADAAALGLPPGTVLYYDMERYDDLSGTGACSTPTKAFLKGWTDRVKELGYISGVYGSPTNAVGDWLNIPLASRMDAVWLARWDNVMSVWTYNAPSPVVPQDAWGNHQRIKQWQAPHNETWGGVTFNIDGNIADGPVAGIAIPRNKTADFDGDGRTDVSIWRPDTGVWYIANSATPTFKIQGFGLPTDTLAPGDYDGDGKTDLAVWRPENGVWHLYSRSIYRSYQFGGTEDIPVPADYDGDGRTDMAVFRPSTGVWYIANSFDSRGTSFRIEQFGLTGDKPVPGDFDGDGKADLAVFRPSDGVWYLLRSTAGFTAVQFGFGTDRPVQADYDGDGKTDVAVYRDGVWYLFQSQAGIYVTSFGLAEDRPAPGDFDGDGKADVAVFRPDTGVWYIMQSQNGFFATQFGVGTDRPVPSAYLPQ